MESYKRDQDGKSVEEGEWKEMVGRDVKLILRIPRGWEKIATSNEWIERKFPYQRKPQEILGEISEERMLTVNFLGKQLKEAQVYPAIRQMQILVNRLYPESIEDQARKTKTATGMAGWFSFITGGLKKDNGHCMFVVSVQGNMALGSYHFPAEEDLGEDKRIFKKIIKSLQTEKRDDDGTRRI